MTPPRIETATSRFVVLFLNQLCHRVPRNIAYKYHNYRYFCIISCFFYVQTLLVIIGWLANVQGLNKLPLIVPLTSEYRTAFGNNWKREKVNCVSKCKFYRQTELSAVSWSLTSRVWRVSYDLALSVRSSITSLLGQKLKRLPNFCTRFPYSRALWFWKADVIFYNF